MCDTWRCIHTLQFYYFYAKSHDGDIPRMASLVNCLLSGSPLPFTSTFSMGAAAESPTSAAASSSLLRTADLSSVLAFSTPEPEMILRR